MINRTVLVTGGNGYIGSNVIKALLNMDVHVIAVSRQGNGRYIDSRAQTIEYDVFDSDGDTFEELGSPDVCIHLAWRNGFIHNDPSHLDDLPGHFGFISNLVSGGLKHIVVMGSMHELGYVEGAVSENTTADPQNLYGVSKNALRQALAIELGNEDCVFQWLRGYYILGQDERNNSVFTKLLQKARQGEKTFPFSSGTNQYDFISIDDLALEIALTSLQTTVAGVINCCSGRPTPLKDRVEEFILTNHLNIALDYGAFPDRPYDSPVVYGDNSKITRIVETACQSENMYTNLSEQRLNELLAMLKG